MKTIINGQAPFQVLSSNFVIGNADAYTLQVSADGVNYSDLFSVGADVTRMVTDMSAGAFYRLAGNSRNGVVINWMKSCGEGGGSGEAGVASLNGQKGNLTLKTINGNDLLGGGNIEIEGGSSDILKSRTDFPEDAQNGDVVATKDGVYQNNKTENIEEVFNSENVRLQAFNKMMQVCVQNTDQSYVQYAIKTYPDKESYDRDENFELKYNGLYLGLNKRTEGGDGSLRYRIENVSGKDPANSCPLLDSTGQGIVFSEWWGEMCFGDFWNGEPIPKNEWTRYSQNGATIEVMINDDGSKSIDVIEGSLEINPDWADYITQEGGSETFYDLFYSTDGHNLITLHTFAEDAYGETAVGEIEVPYDIPGDFQYVAKVGYEVHYGEETPEFTKYILHSVEDADVNGLSRLVINGTNASNGWWYAERKVSADNWTAIGGGSASDAFIVKFEADADTGSIQLVYDFDVEELKNAIDNHNISFELVGYGVFPANQYLYAELRAAKADFKNGTFSIMVDSEDNVNGTFEEGEKVISTDASVLNIISLTEEEYQNLETKDSSTLYIIIG